MKIRVTRNRAVLLLILLALSVWLGSRAGGFLIVDAPRRSDVILVLAGETAKRPQRALQLLQHGYGKRIIIDVPNAATIYEFKQTQLAEKYIQDQPLAASMSICPIEGLSTEAESKNAAVCIARTGARSILIVTSDFHTRRALSTFGREAPGYDYSVAATGDEAQFGVRWWTHRQWAKIFFDEWVRLLWWKAVDQWR